MAEIVEFKNGVQCHVLACNGTLWEGIAKTALTAPKLRGNTLIITSISDGVHSRGSVHKAGLAFDVRFAGARRGAINETKNQFAQAKLWADRLRRQLGSDWDVVVESDHIHVEYDPK